MGNWWAKVIFAIGVILFFIALVAVMVHYRYKTWKEYYDSVD